MTPLEQKMLAAVEKAHYDFGNASGGSEDFFIAEAVTKITLDLAEKCYEEGYDAAMHHEQPTFKQFIQDYE